MPTSLSSIKGPLAITTIPGATATDATSLVGTTGADVFSVTSSPSNVFIGALAGNDRATVTGSVSAYTVRMGADDDSIRFTAGLTDSFVNGNADDDTISVATDMTRSTLEGGQGNDSLTVGQDVTNSLVQGRLGNDTITVSGQTSGSTVNGNENNDTMTFTGLVTTSFIYGGKDRDTITVGEVQNSLISAGDGNDSLTVSNTISGATINGNAGDDSIALGGISVTSSSVYGGQGRDTITYSGSTGLYASGDAGNDNINLSSATGADTLYGGSGADTIQAGDGANYVQGDGGNDSLVGGAVADTIFGGEGNDSIEGLAGANVIGGGAGDDLITTTTGNDDIAGAAGNDSINSGSGNDTIKGGLGNDVITFDADDLDSSDNVNGDEGANTLSIESKGSGLADADFDNVTLIQTIATTAVASGYGATTWTLGANADAAGIATIDLSLTDTQSGSLFTVDASDNDNNLTFIGTANDVNKWMLGGDGADLFQTGADGDTSMTGGAGSDTFAVQAAESDSASTIKDLTNSDVFTVASGGLSVTAVVTESFVATSASYNNDDALMILDLNAGVEANMSAATTTQYGFSILGDASTTAIDIIGSIRADSILGGSAGDSLVGGAGDDTIRGASGADLIDVGTGTDQLNYASVNDTKTVTSGSFFGDGDSVTAALGYDIITGMAAGDKINFTGITAITGGTITSVGASIVSAATAAVVLVRGEYITNTFTAGTGTEDNDYLLQYADGTNVSSALLVDVGILGTSTIANSDTITLVAAS